jgi:4-hydroxy-3-polyprenylbenzoate decarboxylase
MDAARIVVGITGASGALYAVRTVRALLLAGREVHLVVSAYGARLLRDEAGLDLEEETFPEFLARTESTTRIAGRVVRYPEGDLGAAIASGSFPAAGMAVVPCSTKSLSGIAHGASLSLIERAAEVTLKERRPLVLVPRESPLSLIHLRNMVAVTEAGATIVPGRPRLLPEAGDLRGPRRLHRGPRPQYPRDPPAAVHALGGLARRRALRTAPWSQGRSSRSLLSFTTYRPRLTTTDHDSAATYHRRPLSWRLISHRPPEESP